MLRESLTLFGIERSGDQSSENGKSNCASSEKEHIMMIFILHFTAQLGKVISIKN